MLWRDLDGQDHRNTVRFDRSIERGPEGPVVAAEAFLLPSSLMVASSQGFLTALESAVDDW